jgi:hypothetical protein
MGTKKKKKQRFDPAWAEAKKLCRLNQSDIEMAKRLGIGPKSLTKNRPSPSQLWKASVKDWIHELYAKRFGQPSADSRPPQPEPPPADTPSDLPDVGIPF